MEIAYPMMTDIGAHFINGIGMLTHKAKTSFKIRWLITI
jgi:hypothetical protein